MELKRIIKVANDHCDYSNGSGGIMKKKIIIVSIILSFIILGVGVYYIGEILDKPTEEEIQIAQDVIERFFTTPEDEMPPGEKIDLFESFPDDLKEETMQSILHEMSHQKIKADEKWGKFLITRERVQRLLEVAKLNETSYEHSEVYVRILEKWVKGDFSSADKDHNDIWTLQDGTVGKADGLLSPVEEIKYIAKHFKTNSSEENSDNE